MTSGETSVAAVNQAVADLGVNASVSSLPESHENLQVDEVANDLAGEAEAEADKTTSTN